MILRSWSWSLAVAATALVGCGGMLGVYLDEPTASVSPVAGVLANYGFVTDYACVDDEVARQRIRDMVRDYDVRDFQFYDWFVDYSTPTRGESWTDPWFHQREICRRTIEAYIDEIHESRGRAWAYVQAVSAEETDLVDPSRGIHPVLDAKGAWVHHADRLPLYFANADWAVRMVGVWADEVAALRFDGIHWDTLGARAADYGAETAGIHQFLRTAKPLLASRGLLQTMNFVDLAWWDEDVIRDTVAFPYAEIWSMAKEQRYYELMATPKMHDVTGAMPFYPSVEKPDGWSESDVMLARWSEACRHHLRSVVIGDGSRRLIDEYFPKTTPITEAERAAFASSVCSNAPGR